MLADNLVRVRQRIQQACERRGREPSSVTLVCVTKGVSLARIREAVAVGVTELGENRVQEAREKIAAVPADAGVRWHLIGHLQRNKARQAVQLFPVIHSVDSQELAEELERQAAARNRITDVFLQVNVSGEATKFGCAPDEAAGLGRQMTALAHLQFAGLMTIAPLSGDPEQARPHFRRLREVRDAMARELGTPVSSLKLSMGMSHDFEVAIEEGADLVRIGTAIFGTQPA